jgi:transcriptional regulator of acetoin/glycerol metabolism
MLNVINKEHIDPILRGEISVKDIEDRFREELYKLVMEKCKGNQSRAAKDIGVSRSTLRKELKHHFGDRYFQTSMSI